MGGAPILTKWSSNVLDLGTRYTLDASGKIATTANTTDDDWKSVRGLHGKRAGKWYVEFSTNENGFILAGLGNIQADIDTYPGSNAHSVAYNYTGNITISNNQSQFSGYTAVGTGDVIGCAVDFTLSKMWFRVNGGTWRPSGDPAAGTGGLNFANAVDTIRGMLFPMASVYGTNKSVTINPGPTFAAARPAGFEMWSAVTDPIDDLARPNMTANTVPKGMVVSDSAGTGAAYRTFDSSSTTFDELDGAAPWWFKIDLRTKRKATDYRIRARNDFDQQYPTDWILQGSNNNSNWTYLDTRANQAFSLGQNQVFTIASPASFRFYRLYVTSNDNNPTVCSICDLQFTFAL